MSVVIVAPHPDDEIIGCYSILKSTKQTKNIVYTTNVNNDRRKEALNIKNYFDVRQFFVNNDLPPVLLDKNNTFYFPDHINEFHPDHRKSGMIGEQMLRNGFDVVFYSIQMNTPYLFELDPEKSNKEEILNNVYPSQKSLWEYDKKYILFEGYIKWLIY